MLAMKFLAIISLFGSLLLFSAYQTKALKGSRSQVLLPDLITDLRLPFKKSFDHPQNANVLWAFLTGQQSGITPKTKSDFQDLELGFLFSPSAIHFSALMALIFFIVKKFKNKKINKSIKLLILLLAFMLPYLAIKRIVLFRLLFWAQSLFKLKRRVPVEALFLATFLLSFLLGHYQESPLGFSLSFLYIGTFIALRNEARKTILLGLFSTHLIICFFNGQETSILSLLLNIPLLALFSALMPFFYIYFLSFKWIDFNWIEVVVRAFILTVHWLAKLTHGTSVSSTLFILLAVWMILLKKQKRYFFLFILLHGNTANSPAIFLGL